MKCFYKAYAGILLLLGILPGMAWSEDSAEKQPVASFSIGAEYASGRYNASSTTRSVYMPIIISWYPTARLDMSVELPYLYQSSSQVTSSLYQSGATSAASQTVARRGGPGGMITTTTATGTTISSSSSSGRTAVSGLGDIIVRAGYILFFESDRLPQLRSSVFVKTPTASTADGLGTGEFDFGGGFDLSKWFGDLHLAGELVYANQGLVDGFGLKNYLSYNGTIGYQLTGTLQPMLVVKGATAPSDYSDDLLEVRTRLLWNFVTTATLDLFASRGISASSPDYGAGIAVSYPF
ncbi:MAG TPA: hypothetical protein HPP94_10410 [Desulfuromonadales bacterium]|nr:hypothetical protein [Desulfuromonadales bacterium]